MSYAPDWDLDLAYGKEGEDTVASVLGLEGSTIEVKHKSYEDDEFYLELWQAPAGRSERRSGVNTTKADYWAFVVGETGVLVLVPTNRLRELVEYFEMG